MKYLGFIFLMLTVCLPASAHKDKWDDFKHEWSVLMLQIYNHETEKYLELIQRSSEEELNYTSKSFPVTPLEVAIRTNNDTAARALLQTKKIRDPKSYIVVASAYENATNVEMLLNLRADPNTLVNKKNRYSILVYAVNFGSIEVVECLLKHGADVNLAKRDNWSPLIFALYNGFPDKAELLIKNGANIQVKTDGGQKPIDFLDQSYKESKIKEIDWQKLRTLLTEVNKK